MTPAEIERLVLLIEECAEIQQIATKILRFGSDSYHPDDPLRTTNKELLQNEIRDFMLVAELMGFWDDIDLKVIDNDILYRDTIAKKNAYMTHNRISEVDDEQV